MQEIELLIHGQRIQANEVASGETCRLLYQQCAQLLGKFSGAIFQIQTTLKDLPVATLVLSQVTYLNIQSTTFALQLYAGSLPQDLHVYGQLALSFLIRTTDGTGMAAIHDSQQNFRLPLKIWQKLLNQAQKGMKKPDGKQIPHRYLKD